VRALRRRGISILVAESNDFLREKIAGRVSRNKSVRVVSQISDFMDIVQAAMECAPDIVIADVRQTMMNRGVISELRSVCPNIKVFLSADSTTGQYAEAARAMNADGIIEKFLADADFQAMIGAVLNNISEVSSESPAAVSPEVPSPAKSKFKVLAADDDAFFRHRLEAVLDNARMEHFIVSSGAAVLKKIIDSPNEYNCLLLDVHMGGMSGISVARIVRHYYKNIPVILMTSDDNPHIQSEAADIEGAAFLRKPYKDSHLVEMILTLTGKDAEHRGKKILVVEDDADIR